MLKKQWKKDGILWNGKSIVVDDMRIFNPTEEQLIEAGYEEYVPDVVEPTEEELLEQVRQEKLWEIDDYDNSENVNSFSIGEKQMWLSVQERQQLATQISACEGIGRENMTRWFDGMEFTFPLATWKQMLVALEVYAGDALNVTESHKAAVNALTTLKEIEEYNFETGYPEKLEF